MTIRLQNLLVIPPIFLLMGLAVAFLARVAADEEIVWGIEEEAEALAVTVAELAADRAGAAFRGDALAEADLRADLEDLLRNGQVLSIVLYDRSASGRGIGAHRDPSAVSLEPVLAPERFDQLAGPAFAADEPDSWGPYPEAFVALAPLRFAGGAEARGAAVVVVDATRFSEIDGSLRARLFALVFLVTSIGVIAALFLSSRIGRQVRELQEAGESVAAGRYEMAVGVEGVKEVQDLSNTLGTMASILSDTLSRGRRALLVGDPSQLERRSVEAYRRLRELEVPWIDGVEIAAAHIGSPPSGTFFGWARSRERVTVWCGELEGARAMDANVAAGALDRALSHLCSRGAEIDELRKLASDFPVRRLQFIRMSPADIQDAPELVASSGEHPPEILDGVGVLTTIPQPVGRLLAGPFALLGDLPLREVADQLHLALPDGVQGTILLMRPSS